METPQLELRSQRQDWNCRRVSANSAEFRNEGRLVSKKARALRENSLATTELLRPRVAGGILVRAGRLSPFLHPLQAQIEACPMNSSRTWSTSPSLIEQARHGDAEAWRRLCEIYSPLVYGWVRKAGLQPDDAADVVQEVFRIVANSIERFRHDRPQDSFRGWLLTITRNEVRGWLRRRAKLVDVAEGGSTALGRMQQVPADHHGEESLAALDHPSADNAAEREVMRRAADLVKQDFEPQTWQAFWRTVVEERPATEVAAELSMTSNAVRQAKFRVLARLRRTIEEV
jgi:RNA polymerase sigma-70 factor (ECF subfamily)